MSYNRKYVETNERKCIACGHNQANRHAILTKPMSCTKYCNRVLLTKIFDKTKPTISLWKLSRPISMKGLELKIFVCMLGLINQLQAHSGACRRQNKHLNAFRTLVRWHLCFVFHLPSVIEKYLMLWRLRRWRWQRNDVNVDEINGEPASDSSYIMCLSHIVEGISFTEISHLKRTVKINVRLWWIICYYYLTPPSIHCNFEIKSHEVIHESEKHTHKSTEHHKLRILWLPCRFQAVKIRRWSRWKSTKIEAKTKYQHKIFNVSFLHDLWRM